MHRALKKRSKPSESVNVVKTISEIGSVAKKSESSVRFFSDVELENRRPIIQTWEDFGDVDSGTGN